MIRLLGDGWAMGLQACHHRRRRNSVSVARPAPADLLGLTTAMTIRSLLYVSRSRVAMPGGAAVVNAIVQGAVAWNGANGVTGALLFTERHFAQLLEGRTRQSPSC
jgi:hypothetical protein